MPASLFGHDVILKAVGTTTIGRQDMSPAARMLATSLTNAARAGQANGQSDPTLGAPFSSWPDNRLTVAQMGPGEPSENFPLGGEPRQTTYRVGWNFPTTPNSDRGIDSELLIALADGAWLVRRCIEVRKAEMCGLEWEIVPKGATGKERRHLGEKFAPSIKYLTEFLRQPEGYYSFVTDDEQYGEDNPDGVIDEGRWRRRGLVDWSDWMNAEFEDRLVGDWMAIWPQRTLGNHALGLRRVHGANIKPLIDLDGRIPPPPMPAWQQYLYGVPRASWAADEFYYMPHNVRNEVFYGFSNVEQALVLINEFMHFDEWTTAAYTTSTIPQSTLESAPGTPGNLINEAVDALNSAAISVQARQNVHAIPAGAKLNVYNPFVFNQEMAMWVIEGICACFDVQPQELGYAPARSGLGGKGFADMQAEVHRRKTLIPTARWMERKLTRIINEQFREIGGQFLEFKFTDIISEDAQAKYSANQIALQTGQKSLDEILEEEGKDGVGMGHVMQMGAVTIFVDKGYALSGSTIVALPKNASEIVDTSMAAQDGSVPPKPIPEGGDQKPDPLPPKPPTTKAALEDLARWRRRTLKDAKEGRALARPFASEFVDSGVAEAVALKLAAGRDIRSTFKAAESDQKRREHEAILLAAWMRFWEAKVASAKRPLTVDQIVAAFALTIDDQARLAAVLNGPREAAYLAAWAEESQRANDQSQGRLTPQPAFLALLLTGSQQHARGIANTYQTDLQRQVDDLLATANRDYRSEDAQVAAIWDALEIVVMQRADWKGEQVAATEVADAAAQAARNLMQAHPKAFLGMRWRARMDGRTCGICRDLDGQILDQNGPFPPAHPNCRCVLIGLDDLDTTPVG